MQMLRAAVVSCALLGLTLGGCNKAPPKKQLPPLVPVGGTVTLDGKPLPGATVTFIAKNGNYFGVTDDNGHYELMVNEENKGAAVGDFKVLVNKWVTPDGKDLPKGVSPLEGGVEKLPPKYSQEAGNQLKATVPSGGSSTLDFKLTSK